MHAGGVGNISQDVIDEQMTVLDLAFAGFYGGTKTGFKFDLEGVTRTDNAAWHLSGPGTKEERDMKKALRQGGWDALNLYATTAGAYLGWAYFPGLPDAQQHLDGIVVDWESMPGASSRYAGRYDLGQTATHEAGHWFQLHHVFNGGCNRWGDYVEDTPPQLTATNGCPIDQDSCKEPGLDSIHNYMDYSYDACYDQFTAGQTGRMQDAWLFYRADGWATSVIEGRAGLGPARLGTRPALPRRSETSRPSPGEAAAVPGPLPRGGGSQLTMDAVPQMTTRAPASGRRMTESPIGPAVLRRAAPVAEFLNLGPMLDDCCRATRPPAARMCRNVS